VDPAQVMAEFKIQLQQNVSRLPDHGASGSASDLPSQYIEAADKFVMGTANPAFAQQVADNLATRYASQAAIFSSTAARLEAKAFLATDPAKAKALRDLATIYRQTAAKFANVDAAYLLAKYPPGEKIIIIKLGDVRVGYGPAPKT
jgi:regulator of sirC expression with transglutaminase-like and TPR domain